MSARKKASQVAAQCQNVAAELAHTASKHTNAGVPDAKDKYAMYAKAFTVCSMMGCAVGVASKRLTRDALYGAGLGIIGLQLLSTRGYIDINWKAITDDVTKVADQNGDGKLNVKDAKIVLQRLWNGMVRCLPDVSAFSVGFAAGFIVY